MIEMSPRKAYFGEDRPLAFAHRGGAKRWPENTLFAFENALALGYRWIETDLHLSADGRLVVFHDATLDRTTNGTGAIAKATLGELRSLDAGHGFRERGRHPYRGQGLRIPTLEEALGLHSEVHLNLEMKGKDPRLADALWDFVQAHGVHDRILAAAANDSLTQRFRARAKDRVATSPGFQGIAAFWAAAKVGLHRRPWPFDALQVPHHHGALRVVDRAFVEAAHEVGLKVHVWTIDDPEEMRELASFGVDGIMTDCPDVLLETLGERGVPYLR